MSHETQKKHLFPVISLIGQNQEAAVIDEVAEEVLEVQKSGN